MMKRKSLARRAMAMAIGGGVTMSMSAAFAQTAKPADFPTRPIRILAPIAPGGGLDTISRIGAQTINEKWGQSAIVDNRPGGGTLIAMDLAANASPDGYTLFSGTNSMILLSATGRAKYDIRKAFDPIVLMTTQWYVLVINPGLPIKSVKELVAYSRAKPDALSYGSPGIGTNGHLSMEWFNTATGASMVHVPYKGAGPAMLDIIGGQIQLMFTSTVSAAAHMKSGRLRAIAITSPKRHGALPDIPTVAESGVPGFRQANNYSLYAPAGTPKAIVNGLNQIVSDGLRTPDSIRRLSAEGTEPAERMSPEEFRRMIAEEYGQIERLLKRINFKPQH
jgi:tripartite-type tricarboxylate transporter receptor subunit TctC